MSAATEIKLVPAEERAPRASRSDAWLRHFIAQHDGRCHYCNREGSFECGPGGRPWHVEHMQPIALGGSDDDENLTLACKRCNLSKGIKPYAAFKALAKAAYWQPSEGGLSEVDLDYIFGLWRDTQTTGRTTYDNLTWFCDADFRSVSSQLSDDPTSVLSVVECPDPRDRDRDAIWFIVKAHEMVPRLVAEIRLLRGMLAERQEAA